ncbi:MAG TPA: ankyrin repeat domain-containing protein [Burkholderiales bacterium]|nr:ankyrin repeat domain-containing protein [Burkholderiales bacterium]
MAEGKEKLDFLTRLRIRELILMGLITITAVLANLPHEYVEETLGVSHTTLLAVLAIAVIIGLFLYLKFGLFVAVVLLIAGANMPEQIAEGLNISRVPIVLSLVALVGVGLINYVIKLLPTGLEPRPREKSPEGIKALFYAIEKNNLVYAQKVLSMNFDPNLHHDNGYTPLAYAAMKGSAPMIELLIRNGADAAQTTKEGDTPIELALRMGHNEVADLLKQARRAAESKDKGAAGGKAARTAEDHQPATQAG